MSIVIGYGVGLGFSSCQGKKYYIFCCVLINLLYDQRPHLGGAAASMCVHSPPPSGKLGTSLLPPLLCPKRMLFEHRNDFEFLLQCFRCNDEF